MFSNYNLGEQFSQSSYTSEHIEGEGFLAATNGGTTKITLAWTPVIPSSVVVDVNGVEHADDGAGHISILAANDTTINYADGEITLPNALDGNEVSVSYDYDNMSAPVQAPEIKIRIVTSPIQAKSRKLKTLYAFDSALNI